MADIRNLPADNSDDALVHRLFDLTCNGQSERGELSRVDALVYARLLETYGESEPPLPGNGRVAA